MQHVFHVEVSKSVGGLVGGRVGDMLCYAISYNYLTTGF